MLPKGGSLPVEEWRRRHRALLAILWLNVAVLPTYGVLDGYGFGHSVLHAAGLVPLAALAMVPRFGERVRSVFVSLGLLTAAAMLVHITHGLIEAHFYFFVVIVALTLYEDWVPFLIAVAYVLLHHGVVGTAAPHEVYNRPEAWADPFGWAAIHAFFVALAGAAGVIAWRLNEHVRERMHEVQEQLAALAQTDSLTGLGNRRKAMTDLGQACEAGEEAVVVLLDLDGFKLYNDSFGHPAGDALLTRLGRRLDAALGSIARSYRLGGDEFCVISRTSARNQVTTLERAARAALSEDGRAFSITASYGSVTIPAEADTPSEAMRVADQRMYANKRSSRPSAIDQSKNVLLKALTERHPELGSHLDQVTEIAAPVARLLGLSEDEIETIRHAAELHDVGKVAIPDAILNKAGPLDDDEWEFIRRHTLIGQRIVSAAPALNGVGEIIRASHERWDGDGYPDRLAGEAIPIGARIVAVCDAYDAMTSDRAYRRALTGDEALAELRRCAGTQFDPAVVTAFEAVADSRALRPPTRQPSRRAAILTK